MTQRGRVQRVLYYTFLCRDSKHSEIPYLTAAKSKARALVKRIDAKARQVERKTDMVIQIIRATDAIKSIREVEVQEF